MVLALTWHMCWSRPYLNVDEHQETRAQRSKKSRASSIQRRPTPLPPARPEPPDVPRTPLQVADICLSHTMFTSPLLALPGSPPGFSLGSYTHDVLGSASDSPCLWFPRLAFRVPPPPTFRDYPPSPFSVHEVELNLLIPEKSSMCQALNNSPFQSVPSSRGFLFLFPPATTDQRNWTSSRSFSSTQCSYHCQVHSQASFSLPLPFPAGLICLVSTV